MKKLYRYNFYLFVFNSKDFMYLCVKIKFNVL